MSNIIKHSSEDIALRMKLTQSPSMTLMNVMSGWLERWMEMMMKLEMKGFLRGMMILIGKMFIGLQGLESLEYILGSKKERNLQVVKAHQL